MTQHTNKVTFSPRANYLDNKADHLEDAVMDAFAELRKVADGYTNRFAGKMRASITMEWVSFGVEGDREEPVVKVEWGPQAVAAAEDEAVRWNRRAKMRELLRSIYDLGFSCGGRQCTTGYDDARIEEAAAKIENQNL